MSPIQCGGKLMHMAMNRHHWNLTICLILVGIGVMLQGSASAQEPFRVSDWGRFSVGMNASYFLCSGEMLVPAGGRSGSGTRFSLDSDVGIRDADATTIVFTAEAFERHLFGTEYMAAAATGMKRPSRQFRFHNKTYLPEAMIETRINLEWLRASYCFKWFKREALWIGPAVGAHYVRCSTTVNGDTPEAGIISNNRNLDTTFPVIGVEAAVAFTREIDLTMQAQGMHLLGDGFVASYNASARWRLHPDIAVNAGMSARVINRAEHNQLLNNQWNIALAGWTAGISFGF